MVYTINSTSRGKYSEDPSIIVKVHNFTDEKCHIPGKESPVEFCEIRNFFIHVFRLLVYANGDSSETKGYVSLFIQTRHPFIHSAVTCFVSVMDTEEKEKLTRSFAYDGENFKIVSFKINDYLARKRVIEESSELLPNNCLTMHVGIVFHHLTPYTLDFRGLNSSLGGGMARNSDEINLNLDSEVGRRLYEVSTFFKDMMDHTSKKTTVVPLPIKELNPFLGLIEIIMGSDVLYFSSLETFCEVYLLADKYQIPSAVETCRTLIKLYYNFCMKYEEFKELSKTEGHLTVMHAADMSGDDKLREISSNYLQRNLAYFENKEKIEWKLELSESIKSGDEIFSTYVFTRNDRETFSFYS